jgi:hypothetical protein
MKKLRGALYIGAFYSNQKKLRSALYRGYEKFEPVFFEIEIFENENPPSCGGNF